MDEHVEHGAELGRLLVHLLMLLLDLLHVVVQTEHFAELGVVRNLCHHVVGEADILLFACLGCCSTLLFVC